MAGDATLGMVRGMSGSEVPVVASGPLPQLALLFALALLRVLESAPVAEGFGLRFQCPILSEEETVSGAIGRLFFELRMVTAMLLVEH